MINIDREIGLAPSRDVVFPKIIMVEGLQVQETVAKWVTDGKEHFKLIWVRPPVDSLVVDGRPNPFFHNDFSVDMIPADLWDSEYVSLRKLEEACRRNVQKAFLAYWKPEVGEVK